MPGDLLRVTFPATGGGPLLEGWLHLPGGSESAPAAVVCHPHPLMGGTMDNAVVTAVCRTLAERGRAALRFNLRGTGRSEGAFDEGRGEMDDVAGAVDFLCARAEVDPSRLAVAGYSFGAWVALRHAVRDPRPRWLAGIALVQDHYAEPFLDNDPRPKLLIAGEHDPWAPADALRAYGARLRSPKTVRIIPDTDHFFRGQEDRVARIVADWLEASAPG
ncbi:MAG TPA: alpha/beta hydrolase [Anaerolineales bacterium]|nr:alpha/beta hydrolase [Anaerolineae bacterium]HIQ02511.1 alpha/beta hydrolase [Anaerolineales bacterium]